MPREPVAGQPALAPSRLLQACDLAQFEFQTTAELQGLDELIGQARATEAVRFGVGIRQEGFNLFVLGPSGMGKRSLVRQLLAQHAPDERSLADWCYLNNFSQPHKPQAVRLPSGRGVALRHELARLVDYLRSAIPALFEGDEYRAKTGAIQDAFNQRQEEAFKALGHEAEQRQVVLLRTPGGFVFAPARGADVLPPEEYDRLSQAEKDRLAASIAELQQRLEALLNQVPQWWKERSERIRQVNQDTTLQAVRHVLDELRGRFSDLPEVLAYLEVVQQDMIDNADDFRKPEDGAGLASLKLVARESFHRYQVNVLVSNDKQTGALIVSEDNPTYVNLVGRVEHVAQLGALVTDFTLIKPGALHRANGGYLLLDARKVLMQPFAWDGLKRALQAREIRIESVGQLVSLVSTVSLEPEPIPLDVKIILFGDRVLYYLLQQYDPEFGELFKVAADFEERIERNPDNHLLYARLLATLAGRDQLLPLDRSAVGRVIDHSARLAGDGQRLSTHMRSVADLLREADYWGRQAGRSALSAADVQQAIDTRIRRHDRLRDRLQEAVLRGTLMIATQGAVVGQINGLSVLDLGDFAFAQPTRITATSRLGEGELINIEREVKLSGPIHSKGVLILAGFLAERYARNQPLALSVSLVFEQSYGLVEGDSASLAELCALLSNLAQAPIAQGLAVTGSVNQLGQVQAIGAVNEKIEGFFDICRARGLDGHQGVLIPAANTEHLMLRADVVAAAAAGQFAVYPVSHVDEAMALLTGADINPRVAARLAELTALRQTFGRAARDKSAAAEPDLTG